MNRLTSMLRVCICSILVCSAYAVPEGWTEDFDAAKREAVASGKDIFIDFTGSDWCAPCISLSTEVFSQGSFKASVAEEFVLAYIDYPVKTPQTDDRKQQNAELKVAFGINEYPTIVLADAQGKPYAFTGYRPGGPDSYVEHLKKLRERKVQRDEALAAAAQAQGIARAQALDRAMEAVTRKVALQHYGEVLDEIIALDSDNSAGLRSKYESGLAEARIQTRMDHAISLLQSKQFAESIEGFDNIIAADPPKEIKQRAMAMKGIALTNTGDVAEARAILDQALQLVPDSPLVGPIQQAITRLPAE